MSLTSTRPDDLRLRRASPVTRFEVLRTPTSIGEPVHRLRRHMASDRAPLYLLVSPEAGCEPNACYRNVLSKVERDGGRAQFGWAIWLWPRVLIEAEHHAVYAAPDGGAWRDITPGAPGTKRRLFLPDDGAAANSERRDNIRLALSDDPMVAQFLAGAEERARVWRSDPSDLTATEAKDFDRLEVAEHLQADAQLRLAMRYTAPGDPCFCGRGRRFAACHGRPA